MPLTRLDISGFRNILQARLEPMSNGLNFIYGQNGSGKTSLLEAIYYLSRGRSFRTSAGSHIINRNVDRFSIFAHTQEDDTCFTPIGLERQRNGDVIVRKAGQDGTSLSELATLSPTLLINSMSYSLLDAGPLFRRKFIDWGAFYLTTDFLRSWKLYERALKQRNAALRHRANKAELQSWTHELVQHGMQLDLRRREFIQQFLPVFQSVLADLLTLSAIDLSYQSGWDAHLDFAEAMSRSLDKDIQMGHTQYGPHRADLKVVINQAPAKDILSRGQQKLFICAMIVAQGVLLNRVMNKTPVYLVDDLPSELDRFSRSRLSELLIKQKAQLFLTAVEQEASFEFYDKIPMKMFHVEHGEVTEKMTEGERNVFLPC